MVAMATVNLHCKTCQSSIANMDAIHIFMLSHDMLIFNVLSLYHSNQFVFIMLILKVSISRTVDSNF